MAGRGPLYAFQRDVTDTVSPATPVLFVADPHDNEAAPIDWAILLQYSLDAINFPVGFLGSNYQIQSKIPGIDKIEIDKFGTGAFSVIPFVGCVASAFGSSVNVLLRLQLAGSPPASVQIIGIPKSAIRIDTRVVQLDAPAIEFIPPFSTAVAADPPFQTLEVLDQTAAVVQTIALGSHVDFSPIHPRGVFIRNPAMVDTTLIFQRKGLY